MASGVLCSSLSMHHSRCYALPFGVGLIATKLLAGCMALCLWLTALLLNFLLLWDTEESRCVSYAKTNPLKRPNTTADREEGEGGGAAMDRPPPMTNELADGFSKLGQISSSSSKWKGINLIPTLLPKLTYDLANCKRRSFTIQDLPQCWSNCKYA